MSIQHYGVEVDDGLEDINLKYADVSHSQHIDSLTTVLGIKTNDGILLTSDSKVSNEFVKDRASKIFKISQSLGVAASGDLGYVRILVDKFSNSLSKSNTFTELTLRQKIDDEVVCPLLREYNVKRAQKIGLKPVLDIFDAPALVCANTKDRSFVMYKLTFYPIPRVYLIEDDYDSIGTGGGLYAKILMKQHIRTNPGGLLANNMENNKWYALLTINEIKSFDSNIGGPTQLCNVRRE